MIKGVSKQEIPYVLEDDRGSELKDQTVFWITPKTGHDANKTMQRYAGAFRDGRKGKREVDVSKLNAADQDEFLSVCKKVEHYQFPADHELYQNGKIYDVLESNAELMEVAKTLSADYLQEIFEVANNNSKLIEGKKKG
jgi:hypothetical protein